MWAAKAITDSMTQIAVVRHLIGDMHAVRRQLSLPASKRFRVDEARIRATVSTARPHDLDALRAMTELLETCCLDVRHFGEMLAVCPTSWARFVEEGYFRVPGVTEASAESQSEAFRADHEVIACCVRVHQPAKRV